MISFILRARKAPTSPDFSLDDLPSAGHLEVVAHCISNALFFANQIRNDVTVHASLDGPPNPPKTISFDGSGLGSLDGFDERSIARAMQNALEVGQGLPTDESRQAMPGLTVSKRGFERTVQGCAGDQLFYLDRGGTDIRDVEFGKNPAFIFSDHLSMPRKTDKYLKRLGATRISLGPRLLFASHCIVLVHNELDRRNH